MIISAIIFTANIYLIFYSFNYPTYSYQFDANIIIKFIILNNKLSILTWLVKYYRLSLMSATTTFIPWMLPLTYWAIATLQLQNINPHLILFVTVLWAVSWTMILWFSYAWLWPKIKHYINLNKERTNEQDIKQHTQRKSRLKRKAHALHQKMHVLDKPHILFVTVFITTLLPIPDLAVILHVQKKMNILMFFLATTIGKILNYIPFIYGIEFAKIFF